MEYLIVPIYFIGFLQPSCVGNFLNSPTSLAYEKSSSWPERLAVRGYPRQGGESGSFVQISLAATLTIELGWGHDVRVTLSTEQTNIASDGGHPCTIVATLRDQPKRPQHARRGVLRSIVRPQERITWICPRLSTGIRPDGHSVIVGCAGCRRCGSIRRIAGVTRSEECRM